MIAMRRVLPGAVCSSSNIGYSDQNPFVQRFKDILTKTASLSASRSCVNDIMVPSLQFAKNTEVSGIADVKRPSGGCEKHAGRVIPHCVGPTTLLRHSLPAHFSQASELCGLNQSILHVRNAPNSHISR